MKNWDKIKLGDLCEVITKGTTPTSIGFNFTDSGIKFIKVESLTETGEIIPNKVAYIDENCHQALKRSQLKKNDILFSIAGALGRIGIVKDDILPANTNQALAIIRLKKDSNALVEFIAKYFNSNIVTDEIEKLRIGAAQQNLSLTQLNNLFVPLPPLPEQKRIVSILDEAFAAIAKAKANAEQNLKNTKELFESYLQGVFEKKDNGWEIKKLGEVCELYQPKTISTKEMVYDGLYPVFGANGIIGKYDKYNHEEPQLLITCRGATCGSVNISEPKSWINGNAMVVRPKDHSIVLKFLEYLFRGGVDLSKTITGAAQPQITRQSLNPIEISYPKSLPKQQSIVRQLDTLRVETQKLEAVYQKKINDLEELKKSILQKAFAGELKNEKAIAV